MGDTKYPRERFYFIFIRSEVTAQTRWIVSILLWSIFHSVIWCETKISRFLTFWWQELSGGVLLEWLRNNFQVVQVNPDLFIVYFILNSLWSARGFNFFYIGEPNEFYWLNLRCKQLPWRGGEDVQIIYTYYKLICNRISHSLGQAKVCVHTT